MCFIMASKYSVKLKTIAEEHDLIVVNKASNYETALVTTADINRPAMQLTGFYNYFDPKRLQIIGRVESTYLNTLSTEERTRLAVELHDTLAQNLTGVSMEIEAGHVDIAARTLKSCRKPPYTYAAAAAKSLHSCPTLCGPRDGSPPGSPVPGILQARTLEWVAISFSNA